jgi:hypothetical protein
MLDWDETARTITLSKISDFQFGKNYHIKLMTIGNYVEVEFNNQMVCQKTFADESSLITSKGKWGVAVANKQTAVSYDNVKVVKYNAKTVELDKDSSQLAKLDSYTAVGDDGRYIRNKFYDGELVVVHVTEQDGYQVDTSALYYTTTEGKTHITAKDSAWIYGFKMPALDAVIHVGLTQGGTSSGTDSIWFQDDFDEESLMIERGWNDDTIIQSGAAVVDSTVNARISLTDFEGAMKWTDYVASADVTLKSINTGSNNGVATISTRTTGTNNGYEFGIFIPKGSETGYFRLYDRSSATILARTSNGTAKLDETYRLSTVVSDNKIFCYADGKLLFEAESRKNDAGSIALYTIGGISNYDNVQVQTIDSFYDSLSQEVPKEIASPKTGDHNLMLSLAITCGACIAVIALVTIWRRRDNLLD